MQDEVVRAYSCNLSLKKQKEKGVFVKIRKNKRSKRRKRRSILICHNVRLGKKVQQISIKTLGHLAEDVQLNIWIEEARDWIKEHGDHWFKRIFPLQRKKNMSKQVSLFDLKEQSRINVGVEDVFGKLFDEVGFKNILSPLHQKTLRQVLFARILEPGSKRRLSELVDKRFNEDLPLDRIYRMMDALINKLESCKNVKRLINKNGYLKCTEITGQATAMINEDKITEDARWDGLHAVIT